MTPRNIVWHASRYGIDIVAITDHNACDNVSAAIKAAQKYGVTVLPGMEVETREEIHLLTLFETLDQLEEWAVITRAHMSGLLNDEDKFGAQFVVDAEDNLLAVKEEMLLAPLDLGLNEVAEHTAALGGLCVASHIDRPAYSIISQLGFIPPDVKVGAVETSANITRNEALRRFAQLSDWPVLSSSDAHTIEAFVHGPKTRFVLETPTLSEIKMALKGESLRRLLPTAGQK
jgi:predicted metal-dependent phosphoesterase TrpH